MINKMKDLFSILHSTEKTGLSPVVYREEPFPSSSPADNGARGALNVERDVMRATPATFIIAHLFYSIK